MPQIKRLPDAEFEVMKALWENDGPMDTLEIMQSLSVQHNWAITTIRTMLTRLEAKGFVDCVRKARSNIYSAAVSRDAYLEAESKTVLNKLFDGSPRALMTALVQGDSLSDSDIAELERYLHEVKNRRD